MKIKALKNKESGKDIYIIANGHSANNKDVINALKGKITIGMNATPLLTEKYGLQLDYYTVSDERFLRDKEKYHMATEMLNKQTVRVFRSELIKHDSPSYIDNTYYIRSLGRDGFSFNLANGFYFGCTTTMFSIQLATYLGARNIYLVGVDLQYPRDKPRFYSEREPAPIDNFTCVQIKNIRDAYKALQQKNVGLFNCSKNSLLKPYLPFFEG
ncbi:6-hydroxymethylpterin diphosphokinase MptE-like protein [Aeromonas hydrophila]|uniref:6-hydroxymethylpterin diphosphokinase MptE-like protein n=1 Tax=Aeromonas hydrophila TaxID=644 RepID=UPI0038D0C4FA